MFTRVRGNTIQFAMPLQGKTFFAGGIAVYDFVPAPTDIITVVMQDRKAYTYTPTVQSNMLLWTDEGNLDVGMYSVEVLVERQDGTHLRCVRINQVNIVETNAESELDFPVVDSSAEETTPEQVEASQFEETVQGADSGTEETKETAASGEETPTRAVHTSDFEETGPSYDSDVPLTDGPNERFIPRDILSAGVFIFAGDGELGIREIAEGVFESRIVDVEAGLIHDYTAKIAISARELKSDYEEAIYDATGAITEAYQSEILQTARQISLTVEQYKSESDGHYSELSSELILQSDRIETKVSQADYDENNDLIEIRFSDVTQTAELIRQQVVDNKRDADGNFERMQSEITQNAAEIAAKVSLLQYNADKQQYNQQFSELVLRSDQISAKVVANKTEEDALIQALERRIVMDENGISTLVANLNILGGEVTVAQSQIIQLANSIGLKVNQSDYNVDKQQILNRIATLTVDVDGIHAEVSSAEQTISAHTLVLAQYALDIQDLQNQIDGAIDTWFYDYPPVHVDSHGAPDSTVPLITDSQGNPVEPYYDWYYAETQAEPEKVRDSHLGDIFYDNASGYAYRFEGSGQPGSRVYSWAVIQDSAVITALENAARAQDTADHKRRVFVSQPYGPYDVGDLWVQGHVNTNDGAIFRCQTATSVENYFAAGDWVPAADYVSTKLERSNLEILSNAIVGTVSSYTYNADGTISSNTQSLIQQNASSIILQVAGTELATVGIYINGANDRIVLKSNNVFFQGSGDQTETALAITHDPLTGATKIAASNLEINNLVLGGYTGTSSAWQIWAGMSGEYDTTLAANRGGGVAGWFGGEKIDWKFLSAAERASQRYAKSLFRFDGSGYLAGGEIQWGANGEVIIHGTSIEGTTGTFTTLSDGTTTFSVADLIELKSWFTKAYYVDGNGVTHYYLKLVTSNDTGLEGFGTDGFVTAGGVGSGGGGGGGTGLDVTAMYANLANATGTDSTYWTREINVSHLHEFWKSLQNNDIVSTYDNYKIAGSHIPDMAATYGYLKSADIGEYLISLQSQIDSVASRSVYDELSISNLYADMVVGTSAYFGTIYGNLSGTATGADNADKLDGVHASGLFTELTTIGGSTNLYITIGGTRISGTVYAYYDGDGEIISSNMATIGASLRSIQAQVDSVALKSNFEELTVSYLNSDIVSAASLYGALHGNADTATSSTYSTYATNDSAGENITSNMTTVGASLRSLQAQIDSVSAKRNFEELIATYCYSDVLSVGAEIKAGGQIYSVTGVYSSGYGVFGAAASSSDERLKDNIESISPERAWDVLMRLKPREWVWNSKYFKGGEHCAGFVAQEVMPIIPFSVIDNNEYLHLTYDVFHGFEVAGLQDHELRIRALERKMEILTNNS